MNNLKKFKHNKYGILSGLSSIITEMEYILNRINKKSIVNEVVGIKNLSADFKYLKNLLNEVINKWK